MKNKVYLLNQQKNQKKN